MNIIDIAIIVIGVVALIWGAWKGFIAQLISILGIFIGIWGASKFTPYLTGVVSGWLGEGQNESVIKVVVFIVLVVVIILICHLLGKALEKVLGLTVLGGVNRLFGAIFCVLKIALLLIAIASLTKSSLEAMQIPVPEYLAQSKIYALLLQAADQSLPFIKEMFGKITAA